MSDSKLLTGIFKEELKNRFLCLVEVNGADTLCYIPSSCRLSNFLDLTGRTVLLKPHLSSQSRTKYAVFALQTTGRHYILLNMSESNRIIEAAIVKRRFSFLGKRTQIKRESTVEGYKCDLYIEDTKTVVEIKSLLAFNKQAVFPSVFSQRAIDQLKSIKELLEKGYRVVYVFASLNPEVKLVTINNDIKDYYRAFKDCIEKGMVIKGYTFEETEGEFAIKASVRINV